MSLMEFAVLPAAMRCLVEPTDAKLVVCPCHRRRTLPYSTIGRPFVTIALPAPPILVATLVVLNFTGGEKKREE